MTISAVLTEKSVTGTGSTGPINFPYPVHTGTEIYVSRQEAGGDPIAAAYGTDYTVALAVDYSYANITLGATFAAAADGQTIRIWRDLPFTQPLDMIRAERLPSAAVERELDRAAMRDQQLARRVGALETLTDTFTPDVISTPTGFLTPEQCGAVGDGVANDTAAWQLFLDTLRDTDVVGLVAGNSYLVNAGSLTYQRVTMGRGPVIFTAGAPRMILTGATAGPGLTIKGADAGYQMVRGGYLGSLTWDDDAPGSARHAVALRGVEGMVFDGQMGDGIGGYVFHIPNATVTGSNPDPYNVAYCTFRASRSEGGRGLFLNDNGVGLTQCEIDGASIATPTDDAIVAGGSSFVFRNIGISNGAGWAIHNPEGKPGSPNRQVFENIEIDNCANGIKHRRGTQDIFRGVRIYHKYQSGSAQYYPRTALALSNGSNDAVWMLDADIQHVIVAGGSKGQLGVFCDLSSSNNVFDCTIKQRIRDDAAFGFDDDELFANVIAGAEGVVFYRGTREIWRSRYRELFDARGVSSPAPNFPTSGFATSSSRQVFGDEIKDGMSLYDATTGIYTVRNTFRHRFEVRISGAFPLGERVRVALMYTRAASNNYLTGRIAYSDNGDHFTVPLEWEGENLQAGDEVWVSVEAGSTVAMAALYDFGGENYFKGARV